MSDVLFHADPDVLARSLGHALVGIDAQPVEAEAYLQRCLPGLAIVGLPDKAWQEARERVRSGITSAELEWLLRRITVNLALDDGREVMAVPGEITSELSEGRNGLIALGTQPVTSVDNVLEAAGVPTEAVSGSIVYAPFEQTLISRLGREPAALVELVADLDVSTGELAGTLAALELRGLMVEDAGTYRAQA